MSIAATQSDRETWLEWRRAGLGASDAAAAVGISPYETPLDLYCRKLGLVPDKEETDAMLIGTLMEPVIMELYERKTGREIIESQVAVTSEKLPFLRATLDAKVSDAHIVEFKTIGHYASREMGDEDSDEIPDAWLCQVNHQLFVSGAEVADVAVLIAGQRFRVYTIERNERLISRLVELETEFWDRVQTKNPPEATCLPDARLLALVRPTSGVEVALNHVAEEAVAAYERLGEELKAATAERDTAKMRILNALGEHAAGILSDGRLVKRSIVEVKERTQTVKAYTTVRLSISKPRD